MEFLLGVVVGLLVATLVLLVRKPGLVGPSSPAPVAGPPAVTPQAPARPAPRPVDPPAHGWDVVAPEHLPNFASVGGMDELKQELRDTVGLVLTHAEEATEYGINWNGLLFHGPPGVGKSFFARSVAGEFKLSFIPVATSDLVTEFAGEGPGRVAAVFRFAQQHLPCLLFFDEFDAVGDARADATDSQSRDVLTQLLQSLEEYRAEPTLLVAAATNDLDALDPAVIRPGRFDRHIRLDLPDEDGRAAIFSARLKDRPVEKELGLDELARRTKGRTPAAIAQACEAAALAAFRQSAGTGKKVRIGSHHLLEALNHGAGEDRPLVEDWSWKRLVLPERTLSELQQLQALVEDPEQSTVLGVDPPTGVLLTGPPGTGKTTIAKVLAAEAACSFYPVSAADVTSRWVGESEQRIARLFRRARANAPSIVFIAEIDGMGSGRGVLVIGATNRPQAIDPALVRGGRLSRVIDIPLPDPDARLAILAMLTAAMPLDGVDLDELALETDGYSGADLKGLCQQAAMEAMVRRNRSGGRAVRGVRGVRAAKAAVKVAVKVAVTGADFERALAAETEGRRTREQGASARKRPLRST